LVFSGCAQLTSVVESSPVPSVQPAEAEDKTIYIDDIEITYDENAVDGGIDLSGYTTTIKQNHLNSISIIKGMQ